jgi:hypothetical protein
VNANGFYLSKVTAKSHPINTVLAPDPRKTKFVFEELPEPTLISQLPSRGVSEELPAGGRHDPCSRARALEMGKRWTLAQGNR